MSWRVLALALVLVPAAAAADVDMKSCVVTDTSSECVPANVFRIQIELRNTSASVVSYCSTHCPATTANSFPLPVSGANPWKEAGPDVARGRICCITSSGTGSVSWREVALAARLTAPTPTPVATPTPTPTPTP